MQLSDLTIAELRRAITLAKGRNDPITMDIIMRRIESDLDAGSAILANYTPLWACDLLVKNSWSLDRSCQASEMDSWTKEVPGNSSFLFRLDVHVVKLPKRKPESQLSLLCHGSPNGVQRVIPLLSPHQFMEVLGYWMADLTDDFPDPPGE